MKKGLNALRKFNFLSLNIIIFLREIVFSLKRLKFFNPLLQLMRFFFLELKCLMKYLTNATHGDKRELGYINKIETPTSGDTMFVKCKEALAKKHLLVLNLIAHIVRSLDMLKIGVTLDFLRGMSLN